MDTAVQNRLDSIERRFDDLTNEMSKPEVAEEYQRLQALNKERSSLGPVVAMYRMYKQVVRQLAEMEDLVRNEKDEELKSMAREELAPLSARREQLESQLRLELLPKDPNDERDVFVEIRAGTGGEEASLFAGELFRMYLRYAQRKGWQADLVDENATGLGGFKEVVFEVRGRGAFSRLKFESGVHRVQRVPETESSGRVHTSTVTVAVLPEVDEVGVDIAPEDIKIDIFHAGGHGGQNVQKVATAVRLTHIPTGIVVVCRDERSQQQNKLKAMKVLRTRVHQVAQEKQQQEQVSQRRSQVGTGERSEKIRTYNFPQNRLTDHRVNLTVHNLPTIMDGDIDEIIDAVGTAEQQRLLEETLAAARPGALR